jgi:hypothetical protein
MVWRGLAGGPDYRRCGFPCHHACRGAPSPRGREGVIRGGVERPVQDPVRPDRISPPGRATRLTASADRGSGHRRGPCPRCLRHPVRTSAGVNRGTVRGDPSRSKSALPAGTGTDRAEDAVRPGGPLGSLTPPCGLIPLLETGDVMISTARRRFWLGVLAVTLLGLLPLPGVGWAADAEGAGPSSEGTRRGSATPVRTDRVRRRGRELLPIDPRRLGGRRTATVRRWRRSAGARPEDRGSGPSRGATAPGAESGLPRASRD